MQSKFLQGLIKYNNNNLKNKVKNSFAFPYSLYLWGNTNSLLENNYPKYNITDKNIKNSMRHIVGSARIGRHFPDKAEKYGKWKEQWDAKTEPKIYERYGMTPEEANRYVARDTIIDLENNKLGRDFIAQNPNATDDEIVKYAYEQAKNNLDRQYNHTMGLEEFKQSINPEDYRTKLTPEQNIAFNNWVNSSGLFNENNRNFDNYDMQGYWLNEVNNPNSYNASNGHFTDKYKMPNHPSFSNESIYAVGDNAKYAGDWEYRKPPLWFNGWRFNTADGKTIRDPQGNDNVLTDTKNVVKNLFQESKTSEFMRRLLNK